jgi:hypothetical protein
LLWLRVRIAPRTWISLSFECCVLWGRGLCVGLITRAEGSYPRCVCVLLSVTWKPQQWDGLGPSWALALREKKIVLACH